MTMDVVPHKYVITGSDRDIVEVWDYHTLQRIRHITVVGTTQVRWTGSCLVSGGYRRQLEKFDVDAATKLAAMDADPVVSLALYGPYALFGGDNSAIVVNWRSFTRVPKELGTDVVGRLSIWAVCFITHDLIAIGLTSNDIVLVKVSRTKEP